MRDLNYIAVVVLMAAASSVRANDALRCLDLVEAARLDAASSVCRNLDLSDPNAAQAFAYYKLYGEVGRNRLQTIALQGIDKATLEEKRALESARRHFLVAAEDGSAVAQMLLAMTIGLIEPAVFESSGPKYGEQRTYWLKRAAEQGVAEANYQLGIRALSPFGTMLDHPEYLPYLERAAQLGHEEAAKRLDEYETAARLAATGSLDDPAALRKHAAELWASPTGDVDEANRLMRLLADAGDEEAMLTAGEWAWPEDADAAKKYLGMAADGGNGSAMMALGNWYACRGDAAEASRWFKKALAGNHPEARYALNELSEWGVEEWDCRFL